jgi:hypothetical protein
MPDNILNATLLGVSNALLPLSAVDSAQKATELFAKLGYELPGAQNFATLPAQLISKVGGMADDISNLADAATDEAKLQALTALLIKVKEVAEQIARLANDLQGGGMPANFFTSAAIDQIPRRLLDYVIVTYLETYYSGPYSFILLFGFTDEVEMPSDPSIFQPAFTLRKVSWERIPKYFSEPAGLAEEIYHWESGFNSDLFLTRLERVLRGFLLPGGIYNQNPVVSGGLGNATTLSKEIRMPIFQGGSSPELFSQFGLLLSGVAESPPKLKGLALMPYFVGGSEMAFSLNDKFEITLKASTSMDDGVGIILRPPLLLEVVDKLFTAPAGVGSFDIRLSLHNKIDPDRETIIFGSADGSRFSVKGGELAFFASKKQDKVDFGGEFMIREGKIIISTSDSDGFLMKLLSGLNLNITFDFGVGFTFSGGVYLKGSGGLEIVLPTHITLGPLEIQSALIGVKFKDGAIPIDLAASIKAELGPITVVVQNIGVTTTLTFPQDGGNLGPANIAIGFKPPNGIGISIDASVVKGGGYLMFDLDKQQYAGALELSIQNTIQVAAIGVITTKMPDGTQGFSLLIIISVTFTPGIALGMGFFLSGLGGMLGIHRTINSDALREGVKNNAVDNILFPENVVANIVTIMGQITEIFPPKKDQFIIGLMLRLTWSVPPLVTIDFGLCVEFASPVRIAILGVLKIVLPTEDAAVLQLQVNFIGIIDFEKGFLSFDASIFNSRILTFTLEGDMALRLGWGETKGFLMSVGGFHPSFKPDANLKVPNLKRLTLSILRDNPRLVLTCYFAVTSNTVQFGARIDLLFQVSEFKVIGYLYFDVLFQFSPFHFIANIGAGLEVKMGSTTLFAITLDFELAGPTPWHAKGTASFTILFFTVKVRFDEEWGEKNTIEEPAIPLLPKAFEAFSLDANWTTEIPLNRSALVSLRDIKQEAGKVVLQPYGSFRISQTIIPIAQELQKFGTAKPADIKNIDLTLLKIGSQELGRNYVTEAFAPAMFKELTDKDKLSAPSFEQMKSGISITETNAITIPGRSNRKVEYDVIVSDFDPTPQPMEAQQSFDMKLLRKMTRGGAIGKSSLAREYATQKIKQADATISLGDEQFVLMDKTTMQQVAHGSFQNGTYSDASDALNSFLQNNTGMKGKVKVVPAYHVETT